ncbi:unnamed protein product, partial [Ectocarpus sp. 6 AP-2014]
MHQQERAALVDQQEKFVRDLREQHDQTIQQILMEKDVENSKCTESFKKQLNEVQLELLNNRQHMINTEAQWRKRLEEQEQRESGEMMRMREAFQDELASVKSDLSTAHAAMGGLGAMSMADGRRGGAVGTVTVGGGGGAGMPPGLDGVDSSDSADHKVRSLSLLMEEAKKESRWLRERNQELERVVEALRKTIMRQAELSSQRQDQQGTGPGQRPPSHAFRGGRQQFQEHPSSYGTSAGFPAGSPGSGWRQGCRRGGQGRGSLALAAAAAAAAAATRRRGSCSCGRGQGTTRRRRLPSGSPAAAAAAAAVGPGSLDWAVGGCRGGGYQPRGHERSLSLAPDAAARGRGTRSRPQVHHPRRLRRQPPLPPAGQRDLIHGNHAGAPAERRQPPQPRQQQQQGRRRWWARRSRGCRAARGRRGGG